MRYIVTDDEPLTLFDLDTGLKAVDPEYAISDEELYHGEDLYGEIEINLCGEELCDEEIAELQESVEEAGGENKLQVMECFRNANAIVAVRVLWQGRESDQTLQKLDPLWKWLLANRKGIMQADGEGYYDASGLIFEVP